MTKRPTNRRRGYVAFEPDKFERQLLRTGYSHTSLAEQHDLARGTVIRASKGMPIYRSTARQIASALGVDDPAELMPDHDAPSKLEPTVIGEWQIEEYLTPWTVATNTLRYRTCRM